jgi:hypothetical protein
MKLKQVVVAAAMAVVGASASAAVVLDEGFESVASLGWTQTNSGAPGAGWFQGESAVSFPAAAGSDDSFLAANFADTATSISDWIFTPVLSLAKESTIAFKVRALGSIGYLDTVEVYFSASGASTSPGDFALLGTYASATDEGWVDQSYALTTDYASGRFAFRYVVADTATAGDYLGIDSLTISTVPAPASLALVGLALAGVAATRRRT